MSTSNLALATQANNATPEILLTLDREDRRRLRSQLEGQLRQAIQEGRLVAGSALPASRTLARDLGISRSVVVDAYGQLVADGYLEARQGSATRVCASGGDPQPRQPAATPEPALRARFVGGLPDPSLFPRREWLRLYRAALDDVADPDLGYPGPFGAPSLRAALAAYLGRVRGVSGSEARTLVTTGFTQGLVLVSRALRARGVTEMAVEDPCFGLHRQAIANAGLRPVPVPVDEDGIDVERLAATGAGAVLVAPAHSYPTGAVLSPARRNALIAWARRRDAVVVEDDYDAEFRYDRTPVAALQGLDPDRVVYAGCASKTLTPALRLGWLVAPDHLLGGIAREKTLDDMGTPLLEQLALARFVAGGSFARHLRRVRPVYARRRDAALEALRDALPRARPRGVAAGLHLYAELPPGTAEHDLVARARERGVLLEGAAWHWADPASAPPALVIGYGSLGEAAIRRGLALVASL